MNNMSSGKCLFAAQASGCQSIDDAQLRACAGAISSLCSPAFFFTHKETNMTPKQLFDALQQSERYKAAYIANFGSDTGQFLGSDTGWTNNSTKIHANRLGVALAGGLSLHGFDPTYRKAVQNLTACGVPHGITLP